MEATTSSDVECGPRQVELDLVFVRMIDDSEDSVGGDMPYCSIAGEDTVRYDPKHERLMVNWAGCDRQDVLLHSIRVIQPS